MTGKKLLSKTEYKIYNVVERIFMHRVLFIKRAKFQSDTN